MEVEHRPHKKLNLRNISHFANFCCKKFEFGLVHEKENITTHSTDALESIKHKHEEVKKILLSGLKTIHLKGIPYYAIINFFLKYTEMDQDFIFSGANSERKTLQIKVLSWVETGNGIVHVWKLNIISQTIQEAATVTCENIRNTCL